MPSPDDSSPAFWPKTCAYLVHLYTASGVLFAFLAAAETCAPDPDPRWVFLWLLVAVLIDATDGPLARRFAVQRYVPRIGGRTIDELVDYLTFTFVPLLLIWRMGWVPAPALLWIGPALVASLFGFAHAAAKEETEGFFRGFPSYWNILAFYVGLWAAPPYAPYGPWLSAVLLPALAALTVLPVHFLYPNRAPRPWRPFVLGGGVLWAVLLVWMLPRYPNVAPIWMIVSLVYPIFYLMLSVVLDVKREDVKRET